MSELVWKAGMCWLVLGVMSGAAVAEPAVRMFWVTEDGDRVDFPSGTTVVSGIRGERVCTEIWVQGLEADFSLFCANCTIHDRADFSGGGTLTADCTTAAIDIAFDHNFVYVNDCGVNGTMDGVRYFRLRQAPVPILIPTSGAYFAEVCFDESNDALGEATINYILASVGALALDSPLTIGAVECIDPGDCDDEEVCTFDQCIDVECTHTPNLYGDVDHDGDVDLFDLFCILNGFGGDFGVCIFDDVDIDRAWATETSTSSTFLPSSTRFPASTRAGAPKT